MGAKKPTPPPDVKQVLAETIAADLFTDGFGRHAERLVAELPDGSVGGGWSESAVVSRVLLALLHYDVQRRADRPTSPPPPPKKR